MIKFSRAGWNNIIIFAVLAFILLINATHDNVFYNKDSNSQDQTIFGENALILTLTINQQIKIERIGKTWRVNPSSMNAQALAQMMQAWHQSVGQNITKPEDIDEQFALIVSAELAGEAKATVLSLLVIDEQFIIHNHHTEQWLTLPMPIYNQLIPEQLFSE